MAKSLARDLAACVALDDGGNRVSLGSFWADRPAVVCLVRYFDSASCRQLVATLRDAHQEIERRGVRLIVVGGATPDGVHEFREAAAYRGPLVVDPSLDVFRTAGLVGDAPSKPDTRSAPAPPAADGLFSKMRNVLSADVGKLLSMDVKEAFTTDLAKLGQAGGEAVPEHHASTTTRHDSGVFAVGPGDTVSFEWRARGAGDLPKIADLLAALPAPRR